MGNMASNDEGRDSGECDDVYRAADEFFSLADIETSAVGDITTRGKLALCSRVDSLKIRSP